MGLTDFPLIQVSAAVLLAASLSGCALLGRGGSAHEDDGGHKGQVVDAITGKGLRGAWLTGALPTFRDRVVKTRGDGYFCYHFHGDPGGITFHCKGYEPMTVPIPRFLQASLFELKPDRRLKSRIWENEKEDILTPFERSILGGGSSEK